MRRVVAFVDRSPEAVNAAWRAALVARARRMPLHLLALQPLHANLAEAATLVDRLAGQVRGRMPLEITSQAVAGTIEHEGVEAGRDAALMVMPSSPARGGWRPGSPVLRMLRASGRPVLAVRLPAHASYRRVVAAVRQDLDACSVIAAAHAVSRDPCMKVVHVLDVRHEDTMRLADVPERSIRQQRERDAQRARRVLGDLIAAAGAGGGSAEPVVAFGSAARAVLEQELDYGADLLVVGQRPRHLLVEALCGGLAGRVLRGSAADVLLMPLARRSPGERWRLPALAMDPA